jgi:hypothetical protein
MTPCIALLTFFTEVAINNQVLSILQEINSVVVKDLLRLLDLNATELPALVPRLIMPGLRDMKTVG